MHLKTQKGLSADQLQYVDRGNAGFDSSSNAHKEPSSLGLLALTYGDDSDEEDGEAKLPDEGFVTSKSVDSINGDASENSEAKINCRKELSLQTSESSAGFGLAVAIRKDGEAQTFDFSDEFDANSSTVIESNSLTHRISRNQIEPQHDIQNSLSCKAVGTSGIALAPREPTTMPFTPKLDEDSSRLHVFCLQHAMQVEKWLSHIGGVDVYLVCHPGEVLYIKYDQMTKSFPVLCSCKLY